MDYLTLIKSPIASDLAHFIELFNDAMTYSEGLLSTALSHIRQHGGKRMRPILILLMAKNFGRITNATQHAAVGLELLHTASLVHDDVVDESSERRGQASVNATYDNKLAVLLGDFILSTALLQVSQTDNRRIIAYFSELGRTLAAGEILQLSNISNQEISEEVYYQIIKNKTAALFEACAAIGAMSSGATEAQVVEAGKFGQNLGMMFQIRDDIFDYYDSREIGKPTGNDMAEGKLTLPVIYALQQSSYDSMMTLARKVKNGTVNRDEIAVLVDFTKQQGGIEYAERRMEEISQKCFDFIERNTLDNDIRQALRAYVDFVINRKL